MRKQLGIIATSLVFALAVTVPVGAQAPGAGIGSERGEQMRTNAQERVEQIREDVNQRQARARQDVCERREDRLRANMPNYLRGATALQSSIDSIYERVQEFYERGQLTVDNYDELNDNVASAQEDAADAIVAAAEFEFELDCEDQNLGQQMDGFRQGIRGAREELKVYRSELIELISALRAEAAEESEQVDGEGDEQ